MRFAWLNVQRVAWYYERLVMMKISWELRDLVMILRCELL